MITREEIDNLCTLSRIGATDAEKDALLKDLENILGYVQEVADVVVPEGTLPAYMVSNVMRDDSNAYPPKTFTNALLNQAPAREGDFVKVQKVL
jgi:aspartyl-tRNA(Asn)/glutamyl-tRNA(Gln) amidotransferase subunit C